ncbi:hypothetical protein ACS0TY_027387 [Phlomoides rotata]
MELYIEQKNGKKKKQDATIIIVQRRAKTMATIDAKKLGTKTEASEVGAGAGASAAATPLTAESAISTTIMSAATNILVDSIFFVW